MTNSTAGDDDLLQDYTETKRKEYIPVFMFYSVIILFGLVGNSFAFRFYRFKARKTVSSFLLAMLAVNDLVTSVVLMDKLYQHYRVGRFTSSAGCRILVFVNHTFVLNSGFIIITMNVDRFQHVMCPFSKWRFTTRSVKVCLLSLLTLSVAASTSNLFVTDSVEYDIHVEHNVSIIGHRCTHSRVDGHQTVIYVFHLFDLLTVSVTILSAVVIYTLIAWKISRSQRTLRSLALMDISNSAVDTHNKTKRPHDVDNDTHNTLNYLRNSSRYTKGEINSSFSIEVEALKLDDKSIHSQYVTDSHVNSSTTVGQDGCAIESSGKVLDVHGGPGESTANSIDNSATRLKHRSNDDNHITKEARLVIESTDTYTHANENISTSMTQDQDTINANKLYIEKTTPGTLHVPQPVIARPGGGSAIVHSTPNNNRQHTSELRITAMMFTMTLGTVLCVVPYFYISLVKYPDMSKDEFEMTAKARILRGSFAVYSALNPYVLGIFYTEFRVFVMSLVKRTFCCSGR